jgi:short-subunit dehydrogenase
VGSSPGRRADSGTRWRFTLSKPVPISVEEASAAEVEAVFATNVFGLLNVTRAVLPHMRAARSGHVLNISSMGGFAQVAGWGVYGATKFAVERLSEAMQAELSTRRSRSRASSGHALAFL